jgi:hypothetical protein
MRFRADWPVGDVASDEDGDSSTMYSYSNQDECSEERRATEIRVAKVMEFF